SGPRGFLAPGKRSDQPVRKEQRELALRARPRVRAVHDVLREQRREVAADRAGRRIGGVGGTHHSPHAEYGVLTSNREREYGPRRDERDELSVEGLALVLRVVLLGKCPRD